MRNRLRAGREIARSYWRIARLLPSGGSRLVVALLALNVVLGLLPVAFVIATSFMIGRVPDAVRAGVGSAEWESLVVAFVLAAAAFVAQQILAPMQAALGEWMGRVIDGKVHGRLIAASLHSTGIGPLEDQTLLNSLSEAARAVEFGFRTPGRACAALLALVARYTQMLGYVAIVAVAFSPLAGLGLLGAAMLFRTGNRGGLRKYGGLFRRNVALRREGDYLRTIAMQAPAAKEIRVFGLADWLSERYRRTYMDLLAPVWTERRRIYFKPFLVYTAIGLLVTGVALAAAGDAAARGTVSLTALALALQAALGILRLAEHYPEADTQTQFGMFAYDGVLEFERGVEAFDERTIQLEPARDPRGLPHEAIRFADVGFRYPGSDRSVLDGLDLTIPAGRCTAIVGLNGAGKTTLVKLLARLYEPSDGALLVDGIDARSFPVDAWRRQIGVIFQDFNRYELSAAENIGLGSIEHLADGDGIRAAARKAAMLHTLERLPGGLETPLARQYRGGADLSGGQWQRVAIARALFALQGGASILVLDEPTAALDVRAEAAFFDRFVDMTRGVTSILISHRFSSVRHADRVVVLEGGRVIEQGTHEELLEANGRYAELFRLQAERFAQAEDEEPTETATEADLAGDEEATDAEGERPAGGDGAGGGGSDRRRPLTEDSLRVLEAAATDGGASASGGSGGTAGSGNGAAAVAAAEAEPSAAASSESSGPSPKTPEDAR